MSNIEKILKATGLTIADIEKAIQEDSSEAKVDKLLRHLDNYVFCDRSSLWKMEAARDELRITLIEVFNDIIPQRGRTQADQARNNETDGIA